MQNQTAAINRATCEKTIIGGLIQWPKDTIETALANRITSPKSFANQIASALWQTVLEMEADNLAIDQTTVQIEVVKNNPLPKSENKAATSLIINQYINEAIEMAPAFASVEYCCQELGNIVLAEQLAEIADKAKKALADPNNPAHEVAIATARKLIDVATESESVFRHVKRPEQALTEALDHIASWQSNTKCSIQTGVNSVDSIVRLDKRRIVTIAARPGDGKSTLLAQIAIESARNSVPVLFITLEMAVHQITQRALAYMSRVPISCIRHCMTDEQFKRFKAAQIEFKKLPIWFIELGAMTARQLHSAAETMVKSHGIQLIVIDYLQLVMPGIRCDKREQEVAHVCSTIGRLVGDTNVVVAMASQLNREVERAEGPPRLSHLRESGAIENVSDIVIFIHHQNKNDPDRCAQLIVAKNRDGMVKKIDVRHDKDIFAFSECDQIQTKSAKEQKYQQFPDN